MKFLSVIKYLALAVSVATVALLPIMGEPSVGIMLSWAYILLLLTVAVTILLPAINMIKDPKSGMTVLLGFLAIAAISLVCFFLAPSDALPNSAGGVFDNWAELKLVGAGLTVTYIAMAIAVVVIVFGEITKVFK